MRCSHCGIENVPNANGECLDCGEEFFDIEGAEPMEKSGGNSYQANILRKKEFVSKKENKKLLDLFLWVKNNSAVVKTEDLKAAVGDYNRDIILETVNKLAEKIGFLVVPADNLSEYQKKKAVDNLIWIKDQGFYLFSKIKEKPPK